jgi:hypothetical protein
MTLIDFLRSAAGLDPAIERVIGALPYTALAGHLSAFDGPEGAHCRVNDLVLGGLLVAEPEVVWAAVRQRSPPRSGKGRRRGPAKVAVSGPDAGAAR